MYSIGIFCDFFSATFFLKVTVKFKKNNNFKKELLLD